MPSHGYPLLFALFLWWFSTGAILYLDGLPRRTHRWTMIGATGLMGAGCAALVATRDDPSPAGAYLAFSGALAIWGWNEVAFLIGWITGPRRTACPAGARGFARFLLASETILWHEISLLAGFVLVASLGWGGRNSVAVGVYAILWSMRLCSKLNIFLGVPNAPVAFLPPHLRHLASYFRVRPMNALFPIAITASTVVGFGLFTRAIDAPTDGAVVGFTLLSTLMALAILEQWLLILPLPAEALWKWGMRSHALPVAIVEAPLASVVLSTYPDANHKGSEK